MGIRDRSLLERLVKQWAQDHTVEYNVADFASTEQAMTATQGYFTWVVQQGNVSIDLKELVDMLEDFLETKESCRDGLNCSKCNSFIKFAEPNQDDGTLICFSCRSNPYG